jgi:peptidoglycan/xylan/chitin deacetylase (PgdA/CDA1 family)
MKGKKLSIILLSGLLMIGCQPNKKPVSQADLKAQEAQRQEEARLAEEARLEEERIAADQARIKAEEEQREAERLEQERIEEEKRLEEERQMKVLEDYKTYQVNELGQVMVLMYHNLSDKPGTYASTPDLLRADLTRLYDSGYRPVSMTDLVNNTMDIPLGTTPVVFTFDDGYKSDIYYDENGNIHPDSVAGIFLEMAKTHDDFDAKAIFYIYGKNPFREPDLIGKKLNDLVDIGFEIGNHTIDHNALDVLSHEQIQEVLAKEHAFITGHLPGYDIQHMCFPKGLKPKDDRIESVFKGSYDGIDYSYVSGVNVGWNPTRPFGHVKFNGRSINRVTCGDDDFELNYWLDYFDDNPSRRYYSDGDPSTIVIPSYMADYLDPSLAEQVIYYDEEE